MNTDSNTSTANCKACTKTPVPDYYSSPRRCAFDDDGNFTPDNWNCVTAIRLRRFAGEGDSPNLALLAEEESFYVRRCDTSYGVVYIPPHPEDIPDGDIVGPFRGGGLIAMVWDKNRGCTDIMIRVDPRDGGMLSAAGLSLTLGEAEAALENLLIKRSLEEVMFKDLELSCRSYNFLGRYLDENYGEKSNPPYTIHVDDIPARDVLSIPNPQSIKNFGKVSFMEVVKALEDAGINRSDIEDSVFVRSAPKSWLS